MMNELIKNFGAQLTEAIEIGENITLTAPKQELRNIVVVGMGGSGIGANFAKEFTAEERPLPMEVVKGYDLPNYVTPHSLVICSSFSGNTEETLMGLEAAIEKGAKIVCVSSGGKMKALAEEHGLDFVQLPHAGSPPRACLGLSLVQQLFILKFFGCAKAERIEQLKQSILLLEKEQADIMEKAKKMAQFMSGKFPVLYTNDRMGAIILRLRQQLNENAKILCSHHLIPEMNHNELVGWRKQEGDFAVLIFRSKFEHERNQARIKINKEIINHYTQTLIEIKLKGDSLIEEAIYAVHLGDWISWELSVLRQVDATEVKVIDFLKGELAGQA